MRIGFDKWIKIPIGITPTIQGLGLAQEKWFGSGARGRGMSNLDIDYVMAGTPGYMGCIASDAFAELRETKRPIKGFIMNLDKHNEPGSHWVAIALDTINNTREYYDTFGRSPSAEVDARISALLPGSKLLLNTTIDQDFRSDSCGWLSCMFLKKRLAGKTFEVASRGKKDAITGERDAAKFKAANTSIPRVEPNT